MAFGNISTLYFPIAGSAGSSQWGTNVRKLLDSPDATADATTITSHGTAGGQVIRTFDPYATKATDDTEANFGWAITPADMNSVAGALRYYPAGNHVVTARMSQNGGIAASGDLTMSVYRVSNAAGGRARTLLGSATATFSLPGLSTVTTVSVTVPLAEVVFEADETIQYSFEVLFAGLAISGRTIRFNTGTQATIPIRLDTPTLKVLADTTGTAAGTSSAAGDASTVLGTEGSSAGAGAAAGSMSARADTTGTATGAGVAAGEVSSVAGAIGAAAGSGAATGALTAVGGMTGAAAGAAAVAGVLGAIGGMVGAALGEGAAIGAMAATGGMVGAAAGDATVEGQASSVAGTTGLASGVGVADGLTSIVLGTTGTVEIGTGGGDITVIRPIFVFDD